MSNQSSGIFNWVNDRLPIKNTYERHLSKHPVPKKVNFWYLFGALALVVLIIQIVSGIWLMFGYENTEEGAFASVEYIMRDVDYGWVVRYMHTTGASMFFAVVYLHMFRGLMYGSYHKPRELVWIFGMTIYLVMMAEGFLGYVLPYGQMSYWGAQVIISLFGSIPIVGPDLLVWILGDYAVGDATLNRFFSLHVVVIPLILVVLVFLHIVALHHVGSNNPDGIEIKKNKDVDGIPKDGIPFHPYFTIKDSVVVVGFLWIFCAVVFYAPALNGYFLEAPNFIEANPLKTPEHIAPLWYLTPYYSVLRAIPPLFGSQFPGVLGMFAALGVFFLLPWLDRSPVKSIRYRSPIYKWILGTFVVSFIMLGWLGVQPVTPLYVLLARIFTTLYFSFFILMPWFSTLGKTKEVPERVTG
jgi:ubiquinol-cytochrome c reductase cytochrome b subunit